MSHDEHDKSIDYIEFPARHIERVKRFYSAVFDWKFRDWGPEYTSFKDGRLTGGFRLSSDVGTSGPLVVIFAEDLESLAMAVERHGGQIVKEAFSFPGGRRFHFLDPSGNELAVWSRT